MHTTRRSSSSSSSVLTQSKKVNHVEFEGGRIRKQRRHQGQQQQELLRLRFPYLSIGRIRMLPKAALIGLVPFVGRDGHRLLRLRLPRVFAQVRVRGHGLGLPQ